MTACAGKNSLGNFVLKRQSLLTNSGLKVATAKAAADSVTMERGSLAYRLRQTRNEAVSLFNKWQVAVVVTAVTYMYLSYLSYLTCLI